VPAVVWSGLGMGGEGLVVAPALTEGVLCLTSAPFNSDLDTVQQLTFSVLFASKLPVDRFWTQSVFLLELDGSIGMPIWRCCRCINYYTLFPLH